MKKLEIEKTRPTCIISVLKVDILKVGLVFSISNFFITKTPLANNWRRKKNTFLQLFGFSSYWVHIMIPNGLKIFVFKKEPDLYLKFTTELPPELLPELPQELLPELPPELPLDLFPKLTTELPSELSAHLSLNLIQELPAIFSDEFPAKLPIDLFLKFTAELTSET